MKRLCTPGTVCLLPLFFFGMLQVRKSDHCCGVRYVFALHMQTCILRQSRVSQDVCAHRDVNAHMRCVGASARQGTLSTFERENLRIYRHNVPISASFCVYICLFFVSITAKVYNHSLKRRVSCVLPGCMSMHAHRVHPHKD
jgi:hypothetical protein